MALLMSGATEATASQMFGFPGLARVALISSLPLKPVKLTTDRMAAGLLARPRPRHTTHVLVVSFYSICIPGMWPAPRPCTQLLCICELILHDQMFCGGCGRSSVLLWPWLFQARVPYDPPVLFHRLGRKLSFGLSCFLPVLL